MTGHGIDDWELISRGIVNSVVPPHRLGSGEHRIPMFSSSPGLLASEALGSPRLRPTHCRRQDRVDIYSYTSYTYRGSLLMNSGSSFISSTDGEVVSLNAMKLRGGLEI